MSVSEFPAQSARRLVNDEILKAATLFDDGSALFDFVCECDDVECKDFVKMTLVDYRATRAGSVLGHRVR